MNRTMQLAGGLFAIALASTASAQTITFQSGTRDAAPRVFGLRVQSQMHITIPNGGGQGLDEQKSQQESARKALYEMANRECRSLKEVFGGDCRLTALNVTTNVQDRRGNGLDVVVATGSATFELAREVGAHP